MFLMYSQTLVCINYSISLFSNFVLAKKLPRIESTPRSSRGSVQTVRLNQTGTIHGSKDNAGCC